MKCRAGIRALGLLVFFCIYHVEGYRQVHQHCVHTVPSGSKIFGRMDDGTVALWNADTGKNVTIPRCQTTGVGMINKAYKEFSILSYNVDVDYESVLDYKGKVQVPQTDPEALGQVFHTYLTIAQPLMANDSSTFQGLEAVLQFGDFLNGESFADKWSIRVWYWNSDGTNIITPGTQVNSGEFIESILSSKVGSTIPFAQATTLDLNSGKSETLEMTISRLMNWCVSTLEVNFLPNCSGYPPSNSIVWTDVKITADNESVALPYHWQLQENAPSCNLQFYAEDNGQQTKFLWNSSMPL